MVVPAAAAVGLNDPRFGTGFVTFRDTVLEVPPFGGGLMTIIWTLPATARSDATMDVAREVTPKNAVERMLPLTDTSDCETKFLPLMVNVKPPPPVKTPEGESELISGSGLGAALMTNVAGWLFPPPGEGVETTTIAEPAF